MPVTGEISRNIIRDKTHILRHTPFSIVGEHARNPCQPVSFPSKPRIEFLQFLGDGFHLLLGRQSGNGFHPLLEGGIVDVGDRLVIWDGSRGIRLAELAGVVLLPEFVGRELVRPPARPDIRRGSSSGGLRPSPW